MRAMTYAVAHRGPDDAGTWVDLEAGIALGHRRLSIVDLSSSGHQPMHSACRRFVLTFNGEIFNFRELRANLEGAGLVPTGGWRGSSDVEVFLQSIASWGLRAALDKSVGMWAFGLWDRRERRLTLVRDRFGEKPLYYGWAGSDFVFGSELKALRCHPGFDNSIDRRAVALFARRTHVPSPLSIYRRTFKLPPGCLLEVKADGAAVPLDVPPDEADFSNGIRLKRYWSYRDVVRSGLAEPIEDENDALGELEKALSGSIRRQSVADVPVGAFLSGGIDSSTIVSLYQKHSDVPIRTFSMGFEDAVFDEAPHAKAVARYLGTVHEERNVTAAEARDVIPLLPAMYDEPFADSSQIPTHLLSRFAREHVTVALTGDGGDELFGGYNRHVMAPAAWRRIKRVPHAVRGFAAVPLSRIPSRFWDRATSFACGPCPPHFGGKVQKVMAIAGVAASLEDIHRCLVEEWEPGTSPVSGGGGWVIPLDMDVGAGTSDAVRMMYCDAVSYLPDDILCKVDRASMAVGLETRLPFLDQRVAETAARIPLSMKINAGRGKFILRKLLERYLPERIVDRPKAGFAVPVGAWIRGPLLDWAEDLLHPATMRTEGWFDPELVSARWRDHRSGRADWTGALWAVLMFQAWLRQDCDRGRVGAPDTDKRRRLTSLPGQAGTSR